MMEVYTTEYNDTWDLIAYKIFGDERFYKELMRANLPLINIAIFKAGIPIIVPKLDIETSTSLPPWRR